MDKLNSEEIEKFLEGSLEEEQAVEAGFIAVVLSDPEGELALATVPFGQVSESGVTFIARRVIEDIENARKLNEQN